MTLRASVRTSEAEVRDDAQRQRSAPKGRQKSNMIHLEPGAALTAYGLKAAV
jgi:hypothetical protein